MIEQRLVSIIVNNYNYDRFLAQAIDSALHQTYPHIEVIVVDDGSTDGSREIIAGYGDRILPILQPNGKQAAAFNSGFAASKGEIIVFLDSDDYLFPTAIEQIVQIWKPELAKIHYRLQVVNSNGDPLGFSYPQGGKPLSTGEVWRLLLELGSYNSTPTSGNALSRRALEKVLPIPDAYRLTADDYLSIRIPFFGEVAAIEEPLAAYRIHTSNQWALSTMASDRFGRFIRHDIQAQELLTQQAQAVGHTLPADLEWRSFGRMRTRLASLRLNPDTHPVQGDRALSLVYWGIRALWKYSEFNWQKRVIHSLWFLWVGLLPLFLAEPAITWSYAPHFRPRVIHQTLTRVRAWVS
jgi:glycosyltransferase involved in cell wall biosynthesis